ncbi:Hypothetical protein IALB_3037 [Ignavibacterium album JCM 16511]|uniref:Uncharacterized protein n=1 Tax=Ignavibacterium album (strain DSM 19864 / JCM 16511 / NBRC 101810 / Mat9-16) TaxID=945713 RepID=I0AP33_IGNAJ|nr:hypothetical protein [Ignavibacterium album]AFH50740.1 Hypothetical protein IALB_3037 [Ignavibacterium album JCM 16511]
MSWFNILKEQVESKSQRTTLFNGTVTCWFNILKEQVESKSQHDDGTISGHIGWFNILKEQVESKSQLMVQQHFTITRWFNILKESRLVGKSKSQQIALCDSSLLVGLISSKNKLKANHN